MEQKKNKLLEYYHKKDISPVKQDISDFQVHLKRREQLYRMVGLPVCSFKNSEVLEIGPGSGYNTLCFFEWGSHVDLIEPNSKGREDIRELFAGRQINKNNWNLYDDTFEDYRSSKKYDIIIAEGFLHSINNKGFFFDKVKTLMDKGSVLVVTCFDEISSFFDLFVRRILGQYLVQKKRIIDFNRRVEILSKAFEKHFSFLKYASRNINDWVIDNLLNPAAYTEYLSFDQFLDFFSNEYAFLGTSPNMMINDNWYKNIDVDFNQRAKEQFLAKRNQLMLCNTDIKEAGVETNLQLLEKCKTLKAFLEKHEDNLLGANKQEVIGTLNEITDLTRQFSEKVTVALERTITLLEDEEIDEIKITNAEELWGAFGVYMYASITKKYIS